MKRPARPVIFGEVLFDRFEDGSEVLGGAPFNVAWNLRGLGLDPLLVSRVGDDDAGRRIRAAMDAFGLDTAAIQIDPVHPTGAVDVRVVDGEPRFDIVAGAAWDFIEAPSLDAPPALLYHGSLALRSRTSATSADRLLQDTGSVPVFFDVNLRPPWWDPATIAGRMGSADVVKLNAAELAAVGPQHDGPLSGAHDLLDRTGTSMVVVTCGPDGAIAVTRDGRSAETHPTGPVEVVDTVGAGDAFSSVLILGLLLEWPLAPLLDRARAFAEAVVGLRGATTAEAEFYSRIRATWSPA